MQVATLEAGGQVLRGRFTPESRIATSWLASSSSPTQVAIPILLPTGIGAGWRPYFYGEWIWTDEGWYWESDEPWGWACYHYGRWVSSPEYGATIGFFSRQIDDGLRQCSPTFPLSDWLDIVSCCYRIQL